MATAYHDADPQVYEMALAIIKDLHNHLLSADIRFLVRGGGWEVRGRTVYAKAILVSGREKHWTGGADFVIVLNGEAWNDLDNPQRVALLDHELCHCVVIPNKDGTDWKWGIASHDVEEFKAILARHGFWYNDLKEFGRVAQALKPIQSNLFAERGSPAVILPVPDDANGAPGKEEEEPF